MHENNLIDESSAQVESALHYARLTLNYYDDMAESYWQGTRRHDVIQNISSLSNALRGSLPFSILDFGCGPGSDL